MICVTDSTTSPVSVFDESHKPAARLTDWEASNRFRGRLRPFFRTYFRKIETGLGLNMADMPLSSPNWGDGSVEGRG